MSSYFVILNITQFFSLIHYINFDFGMAICISASFGHTTDPIGGFPVTSAIMIPPRLRPSSYFQEGAEVRTGLGSDFCFLINWLVWASVRRESNKTERRFRLFLKRMGWARVGKGFMNPRTGVRVSGLLLQGAVTGKWLPGGAEVELNRVIDQGDVFYHDGYGGNGRLDWVGGRICCGFANTTYQIRWGFMVRVGCVIETGGSSNEETFY